MVVATLMLGTAPMQTERETTTKTIVTEVVARGQTAALSGDAGVMRYKHWLCYGGIDVGRNDRDSTF